jgi:uncharacterized protein
MTPQVYLLRVADWKDLAPVSRDFADFLRATDLLAGAHERHLAAVKLTFGEAGNAGYPPPVLVRELVLALRERGARPFLTETNTLYNGQRKNSVDHLQLAHEHGFGIDAIGAPIVLGDGLVGREQWEVPVAGVHLKRAHLVPTLRDTDFLVGLAHATGHLLTGYGGAIKNIGMGLANRAGKLQMHSIVSPVVHEEQCTLCGACAAACAAGAITLGATAAVIDAELCTGCAECLAVCPTGAVSIDWSGDSQRVQELLAEYALAVLSALSGRAVFVNLLRHISKHCDCLGATPDLIAPDLGILASPDPVALDQATLDLVRQASGGDPFRAAWPEVDPEVQIRHGERIGLGHREYRLIENELPRNLGGR